MLFRSEDHEVTGRDVGHARADRFDHAGRFVAEEVREVRANAAFSIVQVGGVPDWLQSNRNCAQKSDLWPN